MKLKEPKIICFHKGSVPSIEALELADKYGSGVVFRNASFVGSNDKPEECAGVCGEVPEVYKNCKSADDAVKEHKANVEAARKAEKEKRDARAKANKEHAANVKASQAEADKAKKEAEAAAKKAQAAASKNATAKSAAAKAESKSAASTAWSANK
jgi:Tfp pilus assembly protein FimV